MNTFDGKLEKKKKVRTEEYKHNIYIYYIRDPDVCAVKKEVRLKMPSEKLAFVD